MQFVKTPLTGLDHFFLALEKHTGKSKTIGNTCRYFLELDGNLEKNELSNTLLNHTLTKQLASIQLKQKSVVSGSFWVPSKLREINIIELKTDDKIPQEVLEFNISLKESNPYFRFYLLKRSNNTTTVVFCWHHLLMDGYGACLYLSSLNNQVEAKLLSKNVDKFLFSEARQARFFVRKTSEPVLTSVFDGVPVLDTTPGIHIVDFSEEESEIITQNSVKSGAVFGRSTFFLAACGIAVKNALEKGGRKVDNFWIPVPQDKRKKQAKGPVLSNHLSLLFFRLEKSRMDQGLTPMTKELTSQMKRQIRDRIPEKYNSLMHYLRVLPKSTYYRFIKGPHGGALSSFLFTVAPEHPKTLDTFLGRNVVDAMNTPPLTFPPGLTFAFAKHKAKTRIFVVYSTDAFSKDEVINLGTALKELLIQGEE